jgi:hypothetical protein
MPLFESFSPFTILVSPLSIPIYSALYVRIDFTFFSLSKLFNIFDALPVDDFLRA